MDIRLTKYVIMKNQNELQSFRSKKEYNFDLISIYIFRECLPRRCKIAVRVLDIIGNDTMTILEIRV